MKRKGVPNVTIIFGSRIFNHIYNFSSILHPAGDRGGRGGCWHRPPLRHVLPAPCRVWRLRRRSLHRIRYDVAPNSRGLQGWQRLRYLGPILAHPLPRLLHVLFSRPYHRPGVDEPLRLLSSARRILGFLGMVSCIVYACFFCRILYAIFLCHLIYARLLSVLTTIHYPAVTVSK